MKKQIFLIYPVLLLLSLGISAQTVDKTVEKTRTFYNDISEKARLADSDDDRGQFGDLVVNELVINKRHHEWRAVGTYGLEYKFFYRGGDTEERMYPDRLVMVTAVRHVSSREYREEFLYAETGALIFYFQNALNDTDAPSERRVYFSGPKAIRIIEDGKSRDRLTATDLKTAAEIAAQSNKIKEIFIRSIKL